MRDVTEACVLPDMLSQDPARHLAGAGWSKKGKSWRKSFSGGEVRATLRWSAKREKTAGCSFSSQQIEAVDLYDWFKARVGEPSSIPWSADKQIAFWRLTTNGHPVGIGLSREKLPRSGKLSGALLHILQ